jgi:ParB family chromosome partitioning protein
VNDFQLIPLAKLALSEANVRKNDSRLFIEELADNIEAKGLIHNLTAAPAKTKGFYAVMIGGRRLRALSLLADTGRIARDYPVPCRVLTGDAAGIGEQTELSLTENVQRLDMTITDEIRAFKHFINEGSDLDAIAKRFGQTRRFIEGRLRLADLAAPVWTALDEGTITLDVAKAYASTPSHERQVMVWEQVSATWQAGDANAIRRIVTHASLPSSSPIARLVTEAAYRAAGGRIESDLFQADGADTWIDSEIAMRLAGEQLQTFAIQVGEDTGYAWVRPLVGTRVDHSAAEALHSVYLEPGPLTEEEQHQADELRIQLSALEEDYETASDDEATEALNERWEDLEAAIARLENKPGVIPDELKPHIGCFVLIGPDGAPVIDSALYSDKPIRRASGSSTGRTTGNGPAGVSSDGQEPADGNLAAKPLSQKLVDELAVQRRDVLSINLAGNPAIALDFLIFVMADMGSAYGSQAHGTTLRAPRSHSSLPSYPVTPAHTQLDEIRESLDCSWSELDTTVLRFRAFSALDDDAKAAWLSYCTAITLEPSIGVDRAGLQYGAERIVLHDHLAQLMAIDTANHWRPTSTNYFDRVSKQTLLRHVTEVGGVTMAASYMSAKKGDLSQTCEKLFSGETIVAPEVKQAALAWVPAHMRFNAAPDLPEPEPTDLDDAGDGDGPGEAEEAEDQAGGAELEPELADA